MNKIEIQEMVKKIMSEADDNSKDEWDGERCHEIANQILDEDKIITFSDNEEMFKYNPSSGLYEPCESKIKTKLEHFFKDGVSTHKIKEVTNSIKRITYVNREDIENNKENLIPLDNGVFDLFEKKLLPFSHDKIFFSKHPIKYDPSADCSKAKEFIESIVLPEDKQLIYEIAGYCFYKSNKFQKFFILNGEGSNGKSTFLNLLTNVLGVKNISHVSMQELAANKFAKAELHGKNANIYADLSNVALKETGTIKALTGEDNIMAEQKFKNPFMFKNNAKLIFSCNRLPNVTDESDAYFRRVCIIDFPFTFKADNCDNDLIKKLTTEEELSGFFNLAIEAFLNVLMVNKFSRDDEVRKVRRLYQRLSDSAVAFFQDRIEYFGGDAYITKKELHSGYVNYCIENKLPKLHEVVFWKSLRDHFSGDVFERRIKIGDDIERTKVIHGIAWID